MQRRDLLKAGVGTAAAASVAALATSESQTAHGQQPKGSSGNVIKPTGFPAKNLPPVRETIKPLQLSDELVCTTPQAVYLLPRDHKFHAGAFYACNEFWEWHYFSGFAKDKEGNDYALFFGTDPVGYNSTIPLPAALVRRMQTHSSSNSSICFSLASFQLTCVAGKSTPSFVASWPFHGSVFITCFHSD